MRAPYLLLALLSLASVPANAQSPSADLDPVLILETGVVLGSDHKLIDSRSSRRPLEEDKLQEYQQEVAAKGANVIVVSSGRGPRVHYMAFQIAPEMYAQFAAQQQTVAAPAEAPVAPSQPEPVPDKPQQPRSGPLHHVTDPIQQVDWETTFQEVMPEDALQLDSLPVPPSRVYTFGFGAKCEYELPDSVALVSGVQEGPPKLVVAYMTPERMVEGVMVYPPLTADTVRMRVVEGGCRIIPAGVIAALKLEKDGRFLYWGNLSMHREFPLLRAIGSSGRLEKIVYYEDLQRSFPPSQRDAILADRERARREAINRRKAQRTAQIQEWQSKGWTQRAINAVLDRKIYIGMNQEMVRAAWGAPKRINRSVYTHGVHEQWVYGGGNYVYFENGVLRSYQTGH